MFPTDAPKQEYLGYNTIGGTSEALGSSSWKQFYKRIVVERVCVLLSVDMYMNGNASGVQSCQAVVHENVSSAPGKCIAVTGGVDADNPRALSISMSTTARWLSMPMTVWLPVGTYWVGVLGGSSSGATYYYDSGGGDYTSTISDTWARDTPGSNSSRNYSIRASVIYL